MALNQAYKTLKIVWEHLQTILIQNKKTLENLKIVETAVTWPYDKAQTVWLKVMVTSQLVCLPMCVIDLGHTAVSQAVWLTSNSVIHPVFKI